MSKLDLAITMQMVDKITEPARRASQAIGGTGQAKAKLDSQLKNISAQEVQLNIFKKTSAAAGKNRQVINELNQKLKEKGKLTVAQNKRLKNAQNLSSEYTKRLRSQSQALTKIGISTKNLSTAEDRLQKQRKQTISQLSKLNTRTKQLANMRKKFVSFGKGAGIGLGVATAVGVKFGGWLKTAADDLDKLTKRAQNLKIPLSELQTLSYQAGLAGIDDEQFAKAYQTFNKNLGELKTKKSSLLSTALKDFDTQLMEQLKASKDITEAYDLILKKIQEIPEASKQAALANAVFGRNGKDMLIMLREGSDGLAKARQELAKLGGGASVEDVKRAEEFGDQLTRLGTAFDTIKFRALTPIMKELSKVFEGIIVKMKDEVWRNEITAKIQSGFQTIKSVIKTVWESLKSIAPVIKFVANNFTTLASVLVAAKLPAVITGITTAVNLLKVALLTNPITVIIAGIATAAYLIYDNWGGIADWFTSIWKRIKASFLEGTVSVLNAMQGLISSMPDFLLPESFESGNLENTINKYATQAKKLRESIKNSQDLAAKVDTSNIQKQIVTAEPLKTEKSQVEVKVKIDSNAPATIQKAVSKGNANLNLDVGNFATAGY